MKNHSVQSPGIFYSLEPLAPTACRRGNTSVVRRARLSADPDVGTDLCRADTMDSTHNVLSAVITLTDEHIQKNERPYTIPALKEWRAGDTAYAFGAHARILLDPRLEETGAVLVDDIQRLTGLC